LKNLDLEYVDLVSPLKSVNNEPRSYCPGTSCVGPKVLKITMNRVSEFSVLVLTH
jgi:hypothetical protein